MHIEGIAPKDSRRIQIFLRSAKRAMAKFGGVIGKRLLTVTEKENELTLVFAYDRYLFVTLENGKLKSDCVPE